MEFVPAAPALPGEALLEIFVYPNPAFAATRGLEETNKFSDTHRLEFIGRKTTELAYMDLLLTRWPRSSGSQLQSMFNNGFNDLLERAARAYRWSQRVQGYPPNFDRDSPEASPGCFRHQCFNRAVKVEHGYEALKRWMAELQ
ncbi:hypothetical protein ACG7TL_008273 [Trametes sanguinea]